MFQFIILNIHAVYVPDLLAGEQWICITAVTVHLSEDTTVSPLACAVTFGSAND